MQPGRGVQLNEAARVLPAVVVELRPGAVLDGLPGAARHPTLAEGVVEVTTLVEDVREPRIRQSGVLPVIWDVPGPT